MTNTSNNFQVVLSKYKNRIPKSIKIFYGNVYNHLKKTKMFRKYFPINVMLEVSTYCNLRCTGCYRNLKEYSAKNKNMSLDDFKMYIDKLPHISGLILQGCGETSLNLQLREMMDYAMNSGKVKGISFTTNLLAQKPEVYRDLFSRGLTQLIISVDSLDQQEVSQLRPGTDVAVLTKNIKYLLDHFPDKIVFGVVISTVNQHTFSKTVEKLVHLGAKRIICQPFEDQGCHTRCQTPLEKRETVRKIKEMKMKNVEFEFVDIPKGVDLSHVTIIISDRFRRDDYSPCNTYGMVVITVEGYVIPCCALMDGDIYNYGNLKEQSFKQIFFSKHHKQLQTNISKGNYPPFCQKCSSNHVYMMTQEQIQ